jgi:branched-chain amino acid transport system permease protein
MMREPNVKAWLGPLLAAVFAIALPLALRAFGQVFYVSFASQVLIYALAATSLNLVLGYGGMVSFGHAAFVGAGAYVASLLLHAGVDSAWIAWPAAMAVAAAIALATGAISLRTRGVYFIMITLAFAQMLFYLANSIKAWGGDEGLTLARRPALGFGVDLADELSFYYAALAILAAALYALHRLAGSRFGHAVVAMRENETRAEGVGLPVFRTRLACFVIGGAVGGLAGALLACHGKYVSPNVLHWTQSGTLMIMVILGGVGRLWGGVLGAVALLGLERFLADFRIGWLAALFPDYAQHTSLAVGVVLLAAVLFAPRGLAGWRRARDG